MRDQAEGLTYFVEGMDCAACVAKVERVVGGLPGAGGVRASFAQQTLTLALDETQTPRQTLEGHLRGLGYVPALLGPAPLGGQSGAAPGEAPHAQAAGPRAPIPWFRTAQGRLVLLSGGLLLLAVALSAVAPALSVWGFAAATLAGAWPLARKAWASARLGEPFSINLLVTLAALGAVLIGEAAEGAVVVFLFAVGELLEGVAAGRARAGIQALSELAPRTALLLLPGGGVREVQATDLVVGQRVQVGPGARVPADGVIASGHSSLDESPVTGESAPVARAPGERVYAGSINGSGVLEVEVDRAASDNTIARIIHLVEEAEASKAPTARVIDRFSRWYTPAVMLAALLTAALPPLFGGEAHIWLYRGIALLLIGCPCALVLSVPAAITSGLSAGSRRGLLVKGGAALETVGRVRVIAFDKTGTLTAGHPRVTDVIGAPEDELLSLAAAVETGSTHPLARALTEAAAARSLTVPAATSARALPGEGVEAEVGGDRLALRSPRSAAELAGAPELAGAAARFEEEGKTAVVLCREGRALGVIALRDEPRPDARAGLARLRALGIRPVMLSGDNARTARAIAGDLGLEAQAELLPADKLRLIQEWQAAGPVAMVGDGINDAPALAKADVGIAMGGGTDVALETADAALLRARVGDVADLVELSRATLGNIRQNVAFALGLKAVFLVTTLLGYTNLWMAVLADTGATALVTANALRLLRWRGGAHD